jgi:hypothetical protein
MSDNPYQPPTIAVSPLAVPPKRQWRQLRRIAIYQKAILFCLLIYAAAVIVSLILPDRFAFILFPLVIADVVIAAILVFLLSIEVYGVFLGITMGLFTLLPGLGLFILALTNGRASALLRRNKLRVGMFGASLSELASAASADRSE